jgi:hypothetical protein
MLHNIQLPLCSAELLEVVKFQRKVLAFACTAAGVHAIDQAAFDQAFGDAGAWFWKKLSINKNALHQALTHAITHISQHPQRVQIANHILAAFDADVAFHEHYNDAAFQFHFQQFDPPTQHAIRPLMQAFYDLLSSGFPACVHGHAATIKRDTLIEQFWDQNTNLNVCPACDGPRPPTTGRKVHADADHFLPKSRYPFLAIHPANLVPTCSYCNRNFKLTADPLQNSHGTVQLADAFHPYGRAAINHITTTVHRGKAGEHRIEVTDHDGTASQRVTDWQGLYKLKTRWPADLRIGIDRIMEVLRHVRAAIEEQHGILSEEALRKRLESMLTEKNSRMGEDSYYVLQTSYLRFALADADEFKELFYQFTGQGRPAAQIASPSAPETTN